MRRLLLCFIIFYFNNAYASPQNCKDEAFEYLQNHPNSFSGNINVSDYVMTDTEGSASVNFEKINPINTVCQGKRVSFNQ